MLVAATFEKAIFYGKSKCSLDEAQRNPGSYRTTNTNAEIQKAPSIVTLPQKFQNSSELRLLSS
jgi:hypothetical protein